MMKLPTSAPEDWYLVRGKGGPSQWFDKTPLESVLAMAILMTGAGDMSAADEVTLQDKDHHPVVTFVANEGHRGCHLTIPEGSSTTPADLQTLVEFMLERDLAGWTTEVEVDPT